MQKTNIWTKDKKGRLRQKRTLIQNTQKTLQTENQQLDLKMGQRLQEISN